MLFAETDTTAIWNAVIAAVVTIVLAILNRKSAAEAAAAAKKVEKSAQEVKADLKVNTVLTEAKAEEVKKVLAQTTSATERKLADIASVGEGTYALVNGGMGRQLLLNAAVTRRLADLTKDPTDVRAAEVAETLYRDHERKYREADARKQAQTQAPADEDERRRSDELASLALQGLQPDAVDAPEERRKLLAEQAEAIVEARKKADAKKADGGKP